MNDQDVLVAAVGFRLATANADLCPQGWSPGFLVHTIEQYGRDYRQAAAQMFQLRDHVGVMSVVAASPAAAAGLRTGDAIMAIDGAALPGPRPKESAGDFARTAAAQQIIALAFEDGLAVLSLLGTPAPVDLEIRGVRACPSLFQVVPEAAMNAEADGRYVQISSDMVALAQSDAELAAVLAHELAHNILGHRARLDRLRVDRGLLAPFGRNAPLIRETESEADRLSIYLMARAGYAPESALRFWERLRRAARSRLGDPTHPHWSQRLRSMRAELRRIDAAGRSVADIRLPGDLEQKLRPPSAQSD